MIRLPTLLTHSAFALFLGVSTTIACTVDEKRPDAGVMGNPNPIVLTGPDGVSAAKLVDGCEDLGTLGADALAARLVNETIQSTSFPVANRPMTTKVSVTAALPDANGIKGGLGTLAGKTATLGVFPDDNYKTCAHCVVIAIGCTADSCRSAALFYPRKGSATFTAVAGETFEGKFENVELVQVTVDPSTTLSTPVPGGACVRVPTLTFKALTSSGGGSSGGETNSSTSSTGGTNGDDSGTGSSGKTSSGLGSSNGGGGESQTAAEKAAALGDL